MSGRKGKKSPNKRDAREEEESDEEGDDFDDEPGGYRIGDIYVPPPPPLPKYSGDGTGTRLVITNIENINFKSYANRQVLGPFHKSFTSIVGPNGSGKSNVIDSMLFVFGYRAQKLRSKKLSILIHNSDTYPNVRSCEVIVHFALIHDKGGEDFDIVAGSEFTVSRTANKDNSSNYSIRGRRVQFKDVSQLLQSHGIDLRYNRFLILQGEVEQIALMKPKAENENDTGMLEFLEDIVGSTRLKVPLAQLQRKVEESNEARAEKLNRVKVVQKEKEGLEGAKNEAILFLETENQLTLKKNRYFQIHKVDAEEGCEEAKKDFERANEIYKAALEEVDKIKKQRKEKQELMDKEGEAYAIVAKQEEEAKEAYKKIESRDIEVRGKIKHTKTKGKKMVDDLEKEQQKLEELREAPDKFDQEVEELKARKEQVEEKKIEADESLAVVMGQIKRDTQQLQVEKDGHENELLSLQKGLTDARSKLALEQEQLDLYKTKEQSEKAKLDTMQWNLDKTVNEIAEKQTALEDLKTKIPNTEKEIQGLKQQLEREEEKRSRIAEEHRTNVEKLAENRNTISSASTRNRVLAALMEQKRKGTIKGIMGRLGDLGAIEKKYDVAISTACGALDNIVTDNMDTAQKCVQYLKDNNTGHSTFLGLDKQKHLERNCNSTIETPEGVPRLFDLVQVEDERVRPAFYFALRDTLVADNLDQATRIQGKLRSRWRVVTLDGKMVETSGAMTGGGRPSSGRMGSSVAVRDVSEDLLREMEGEVQRSGELLEGVKQRCSDLRTGLENLTRELEKMKGNHPKYVMDVKAKEGQLNDLKKAIREQEKTVKEAAPEPRKLKQLEKSVETCQKEFDEVSAVTSEIEKKIDEVNKKIREIMDKKVGNAKKKVENLKSEMETINSSITKANVAQKSAVRNIEKTEQKVKTLETEIEESKELINSLKEEMKKMEAEASLVTSRFQELTEEREQMGAKLKGLVSEINKFKAEENRLNSENMDAKHELEKEEANFKEKENAVKRWDAKAKDLELHQIPDKPQEMVPQLTPEEVGQLNLHSVQKDIENLEKELKKMKPNMAAIEEYKKKEQLYTERAMELEEITKKRDEFKLQFEKLRTQRMSEFKEGFLTITRKLKEMYRMITLGGDAELEWIDSLDPFSEGINFAVRPNKKSWKRISNLSGGEKTLSSLALIFALHYYKPSPLYVMDEIDAALDFKNVSIIANYIKQRTRNTQFIIISLRNNMYELADRLVGIYKTHNCTKSVTVIPASIEAARKRTVNLASTDAPPGKDIDDTVSAADRRGSSEVFVQ